MAYDVSLKRAEFNVANRDIEFSVKENGSVLGHLLISKGGVEWVPKDHEKGHRMKWTTFAAAMVQHGEKK
jgi:hypothetical protein